MTDVYLMDSNTFIEPSRRYYPYDFAAKFWDFLKYNIENDRIVLLNKVYYEMVNKGDDLNNWINQFSSKLLDYRSPDIVGVYSQIMNHVNNCVYYTPKALHDWAGNSIADPWIVAAAKARDYTIVTHETANGKRSQYGQPSLGRVKIPDIASDLNVKYDNLFNMLRRLDFKF